MTLLNYRALLGLLAAGCVSLAVVPSVGAQKKPAPKPKKPAPKKPAPAKPGDAKAGMTAFKAELCTSCHRTKDHQGGDSGPDLSEIGKTQKAEEIAKYIKKPKAGSIMPPFKGDQKTLDDMVAYLLTQK